MATQRGEQQQVSPRELARNVVLEFFTALNMQDAAALSSLVADDIAHDLGIADRDVGRQPFLEHIQRSQAEFREHVFDIEVMVNEAGTRAAAEFTVLGFPLLQGPSEAAEELAETYRLPCGAFFEIAGEQIARISNYRGPSAIEGRVRR